jgi:hypothetical protein
VFPGGVTRKCRKAGEQVLIPGLGRSLPEKATSAVCARRSVNTGTPFTYGPYHVERTRIAAVVLPAAVIAANLGQPVKRHDVWLWFLKAMYPPVCVRPTNHRATRTVSSEVVQLRAWRESLEGPRAAAPGTAAAAAIAIKAAGIIQRLMPSMYAGASQFGQSSVMTVQSVA